MWFSLIFSLQAQAQSIFVPTKSNEPEVEVVLDAVYEAIYSQYGEQVNTSLLPCFANGCHNSYTNKYDYNVKVVVRRRGNVHECVLSVVDPNNDILRKYTVYSSSIDGLAGKARTISYTYLLPKPTSSNFRNSKSSTTGTSNKISNSLLSQDKTTMSSVETKKETSSKERHSKTSKSNIKNPAEGGLKIRDVAPLQKSYAIGYRPLDGYTVPFSNDEGNKSTPIDAYDALDFTQYELGMYSYSDKGRRFQTSFAFGRDDYYNVTTLGIGYDKVFLPTKMFKPFIGAGLNVNLQSYSEYAWAPSGDELFTIDAVANAHAGLIINYKKAALEFAYNRDLYDRTLVGSGSYGSNTLTTRLHYAIPDPNFTVQSKNIKKKISSKSIESRTSNSKKVPQKDNSRQSQTPNNSFSRVQQGSYGFGISNVRTNFTQTLGITTHYSKNIKAKNWGYLISGTYQLDRGLSDVTNLTTTLVTLAYEGSNSSSFQQPLDKPESILRFQFFKYLLDPVQNGTKGNVFFLSGLGLQSSNEYFAQYDSSIDPSVGLPVSLVPQGRKIRVSLETGVGFDLDISDYSSIRYKSSLSSSYQLKPQYDPKVPVTESYLKTIHIPSIEFIRRF